MDELQNKEELIAWLVSRLEAEKTKILVTLTLVCVMGFMWFKVLSKKQPQSASAAMQNSGSIQENLETTIEYVNLPVFAQRHDKLDKNFFSEIKSFSENGNSSTNVLNKADNNQIETAAKTLSLEAIFSGQTPEAFINDSIYVPGDVIEVERNNVKYQFKLVKILKDRALLKCNDTLVEITIAGAELNN